MARRHGSTAGQRMAWVSQLLGGSGTYGLVTLLSREAGVSRQTLYTWAEIGQAWLSHQAPPSSRPLALDEMYGNDRRGAYLHIVDTASHAVWAAAGPVPVDTESWTLVLWLAQERGLRWHTTISDGGPAIEAAVRTVDPTGQHRRDVWHVLHVCAQVQGRLDRRVAQVEAQTATVQRQAARVAAGQRPLGRKPRTDLF